MDGITWQENIPQKQLSALETWELVQSLPRGGSAKCLRLLSALTLGSILLSCGSCWSLPNLLQLSDKRYLPSTLHSGCLSLLAPFVEVKNQGAKERLVPDPGTERPGVVTL